MLGSEMLSCTTLVAEREGEEGECGGLICVFVDAMEEADARRRDFWGNGMRTNGKDDEVGHPPIWTV